MNIFRVGRGDFFGTIVPGAFLLANIVYIAPHAVPPEDRQAIQTALSQMLATENAVIDRTLLWPLALIASYAFGFALRLVPPSIMEVPAIPFKMLQREISALLRRIPFRRCCRKDKDENKDESPGDPEDLLRYLRRSWCRTTEPFPYVDWILDYYLKKRSMNTYRKFYDELLRKECDGDRQRFGDTSFFNQLKLDVIESSPALREEVINAEGLTRFVSGMTAGLMASLIALSLWGSRIDELIMWIYAGLLLVFLMRISHTRAREASVVYVSYAIIKTKAAAPPLSRPWFGSPGPSPKRRTPPRP